MSKNKEIVIDPDALLEEIAELKIQLFEAKSMVEAIQDGAVDALVLQRDGRTHIYTLETADYTYRLLIEKFGEGALSISDDGLILYCNDAFAKLLGIPANKITGSFINSYIDSVGKFQEIKKALRQGSSKGEITLNVDGRKLQVYVSLTDLHPKVQAIGVVVTDLTEKRRTEEDFALYQQQLEQKINELNTTNASLEQFIHVISHDIKEPIRKIITYSTQLTNDQNNLVDKTALNNLRVISTSAKRLSSLVDDLVKYAFSSANIETSEIDLNAVLKEVLEDLELNIIENNAQVKFKNLPKIIASTVQARQLFSNLINNAIKYRKKSQRPQITIQSEITDCVDAHHPNKKFFKISIEDNGIGMDKSQLNKIFTIFHRLHPQHEYSGNGIGLAICKKIMENHHGKIEVESSVNDGSTFNLYFPVKGK